MVFSMDPDYPRLVRAVLSGYALDPRGTHGLAHWARVWETGLCLAETTGADPTIVRLFAIFHDSRRLNDNRDPLHGRRGADLAASLRGTGFELSDPDFALLETACEHHTDTDFHDDPTVGTCWDADRLDLSRVGKEINPAFLNTAAAKQPEAIVWATARSIRNDLPEIVKAIWSIGLEA